MYGSWCKYVCNGLSFSVLAESIPESLFKFADILLVEPKSTMFLIGAKDIET